MIESTQKMYILLVINIIVLITNIITGYIIQREKKKIAKGSPNYFTVFYFLPGIALTITGIVFLFMTLMIFGFDVTIMVPIVIILIGIIYLGIFYVKKHKLDH